MTISYDKQMLGVLFQWYIIERKQWLVSAYFDGFMITSIGSKVILLAEGGYTSSMTFRGDKAASLILL